MKNIICIFICLTVATCLLADNVRLRSTPLTAGTTNSTGLIDCSQSSSFCVATSFAGVNSAVSQLTVTNSAGGTNGQTFTVQFGGVSTNTYTWTNSVTTTNQLLVATNTASAATNLANQISADYAGLLYVTLNTSNVVQFASVSPATFTTTLSTGWGTVVTNANSIAGVVNFRGSNSVDGSLWFRDAARDFSVAFNSTSTVTASNYFTGLPPFNYWKYDMENAASNNATASALQVTYGNKKGL